LIVDEITFSPNPMINETSVSFTIHEFGRIEVEVRDINGILIDSLSESLYSPGNHKIIWNGKSMEEKEVKPGIYFILFRTQSTTYTKKVIKF
jgi:flagellar hook assembly protein FlgD